MIEENDEIPDQIYKPGEEALTIEIPPVGPAAQLENCSILTQITHVVGFGEFDSRSIDIGDSRITLTTPAEEPSAILSFEIIVTMDA